MSKDLQLSEIREQFVRSKSPELDSIRETIAKSWFRSKSFGVDPHSGPVTVGEEGKHSISQRTELFEYVFNYTEALYQEDPDQDLVFVVTDQAGRVVRLIGSDSARKRAASIGIREETLLQESSAGTNAFGTCIYTRNAAYVFKCEHYKSAFCGLITYATPIFDSANEIAATIGIISYQNDPNTSLLSILRHAGNAMSKECLIYRQCQKLQDLNQNLDCLINTMNYGIVILDENACIIRANSVARYFFLMFEYELIGQPISVFISPQDLDFLMLKNDVYDHEVVIHSGEVKQFIFSASVYLSETSSNKRNYILVFRKTETKSMHESDTSKHAKWHFNDIVGTNPLFIEALNLAKIAAKTSCTVLITGESGVGKELIAQAIHNASDCAGGPFIAVNCGAIPKGLAESELFGYENGAFTGAKKTGMPGKLEQANGGTIFLDEIGDMSLDLQICLLRFLQDQEITRVGGKKSIKVNVRVIAATNKNLEEAINNGVFRLDLYYRLNVFNIHVPPLRERGDDIINLSHYFLQKYKIGSSHPFIGFTQEALNAMKNYQWPGNVRELENVIERAVIISRSERIRLDDFPYNLRSCYQQREINQIPSPSRSEFREQTVYAQPTSKNTEEDLIIRALRSANGNVTRAAEIAGFSRRTMYRKMEKYGINK